MNDVSTRSRAAASQFNYGTRYDRYYLRLVSSNPTPRHMGRYQGDPHPDIRESIRHDVLSRRMKGETYQEIAGVYDKTERTIRRWVTLGIEQNLLDADRLKPHQELANTFFMMRQHRADPLRRRDELCESEKYVEAIRVIRELTNLEEQINRIQHQIGLFEDYHIWDLSDAVPGSPGRTKVDDGEDDEGWRPRCFPKKRTKADIFDDFEMNLFEKSLLEVVRCPHGMCRG